MKNRLLIVTLAAICALPAVADVISPGSLSPRARRALKMLGARSASEIAERFNPDMLRNDRRLDQATRKELIQWTRSQGFEFRRPSESAERSLETYRTQLSDRAFAFMRSQGFTGPDDLARTLSVRDIARGLGRADFAVVFELAKFSEKKGRPMRAGAQSLADTCEGAWDVLRRNNMAISDVGRLVRNRDAHEFARSFSVIQLVEYYRLGYATAMDIADWVEACGDTVQTSEAQRLAANARLCQTPLVVKAPQAPI